MIYDRCGEQIPAGEEINQYGQMLCEVCDIQSLSPARACYPWAVRSAETLSQMDNNYSALSKIQEKILQVFEEIGGAEPIHSNCVQHARASSLHL
jgi:hypothetical protein